MAKNKKATTKRKMGRPRLEIDFNIVDAMVAAFATQQEIADYLGVSVDTLERRFKTERKVTFAEYFKKHNAHRKMALRRWQAIADYQSDSGGAAPTATLHEKCKP